MNERRMYELAKGLLGAWNSQGVKRNEVYFDRAAIASLM